MTEKNIKYADFTENVFGLNYSIVNAYGQIIYENAIETTNQIVELSTYPAGMYFLRIVGFSTAGIKFMKY